MAEPTGEGKFWKESYEKKHKEYTELQLTYKEFQQSSHEFETELEEELSQAQIELERSKSKLNKSEAQLRKVREESDRMRRQYGDEVAALQERLQSLDNGAQQQDELKQISRLMKQKGNMEALNTQLQDELDAAHEKIELMQTEIDEIHEAHNEEIQALRSQMNSYKADRIQTSGADAAGDSEYHELIENLRREIGDLQQKVENMSEDKDQLEARLLEESELNEELTGEVSDLTDDFMANSDKIELLEGKISEHLATIEELKKNQVTETKVVTETETVVKVDPETLKKLEATETKVQELEDQAIEMKGRLEVADKLNEDLQAEIDRLNEANLDVTAQLGEFKAQMTETKLGSQTTDSKLRSLKADLADAKQQIADMTDEVKEWREKFEKVNQEKEQLAVGGKRNQQEKAKLEDDMRKELTDTKEEMKQLEHKLDLVTVERDRLAAEQKAASEARRKLLEERSSRQNDELKALESSGNTAVAKVNSNVSGIRSNMSSLGVEVTETNAFLQDAFGKLTTGISGLNRLLTTSRTNYRKLVKERRKYYDQMQDLKGNIRVYCRIRPMSSRELKESEPCTEIPGEGQVALMRKDRATESTKTFTFDRVFGPLTDQLEIFDSCESLIHSVLDGYNVCIFAYGQTGSGKTYTMEGPTDNRGVNFRSMDALFRKIRGLAPQYVFKVQVQLMEIYNEQLRDLLDSDSVADLGHEEESQKEVKTDKLQIRKGPNGTYVTNVKSFAVSSPEEVMEIIAVGAKNRAVGRTNANEHSSRSHSLLTIIVEGLDQVSRNKTYGKLQLIDLAGSERVKHTESSGARLKEATYINKSLSALGDVMLALSTAKKSTHIPYRNSKLTHLLQDSLGGNSKTMMFVNISPAEKHAQETLCSLQFANRVRKVKLSARAAKDNNTVNVYREKVTELKNDISRWREKLERANKLREDKLNEKDALIYELNEQIKHTTAHANQIELEKRKEIASIQANHNKITQKLQKATDTTKTERMQKKVDMLEEKYNHVQQLLKLSQRENKALKEKARSAERKAASGGHASEAKLDKAKRRARVEALARKRAEEAGDAQSAEMAKKLKDKEQLNRALRNKNKNLVAELQALKTALKKQAVSQFHKKSPARAGRGARHSAADIRAQSASTPRRSAEEESKRKVAEAADLEARRRARAKRSRAWKAAK